VERRNNPGATGQAPGQATGQASVAGLLADSTRRSVFAAVTLGHSTPAAIAAVTGLSEPAVVKAIERLLNAGLLAASPEVGLIVDTSRIAAEARQSSRTRRSDPGVDVANVADDEAAVIRAFFADGRLISFPAQRKKQLVVLNVLAQRFDPGPTFTEAQVNLILGQVYADTALLRRHLVDEAFLERRNGYYWRAGGTFEI
jgi:hypothetical protein